MSTAEFVANGMLTALVPYYLYRLATYDASGNGKPQMSFGGNMIFIMISVTGAVRFASNLGMLDRENASDAAAVIAFATLVAGFFYYVWLLHARSKAGQFHR